MGKGAPPPRARRAPPEYLGSNEGDGGPALTIGRTHGMGLG